MHFLKLNRQSYAIRPFSEFDFHSSRLVFNSPLTIPLKETLSCGFLESTARISQIPLIWFSDFPRIWCRNFKERFLDHLFTLSQAHWVL